jgi:hypothetical protein
MSVLRVLKYGCDKYMECEETIDVDKLNYIISNKHKFNDVFRLNTHSKLYDKILYDPFTIAKRYLEKSRKGKVIVTYTQKDGVGRCYASRALSLQSLNRKIRHTISKGYIDIDIKNAGPTILKYICDEYKIACPILTKYYNDREKFFKDNRLTKDMCKKIFIGLMFGGKDYKLNTSSKDLKEFMNNEIDNIHNLIITKHERDFKIFKKKKLEDDKKTKDGDSSDDDEDTKKENIKGKFVSKLVFDIENKILQCMYEYFDKPKCAVLCFDGLMIKKDYYEQNEYTLKDCQKYIFDNLKIGIELAEKPFDNAIKLNKKKITKYEEMSVDVYSDFRKFCGEGKEVELELVMEWVRNAIIYIERGGDGMLLTKEIDINPETKEEKAYYKPMAINDVLKNLYVNCNIINPKYNYKLHMKYKNNPKKYKDVPEFKITKYLFTTLGKGTDSDCAYLNDCIKKRTMEDDKKTSSLISYNKVDFYPYLKRKGAPKLHNCFNLFTGFPMEDVKMKKNINFEQSRLYKHIRDELMDGNVKEFHHFLDYLADIIQDPAHIKPNAHLFYTLQGMGKGLLAEFLKKILGASNVVTYVHTARYFEKFNVLNVNKLLKIFEEVSEKSGKNNDAFSKHDILKGEITSREEMIEPKGKDPYIVLHCARYLFFTNNESTLYIENGDRRFTMHRSNNRYADDEKYFDPLWKELEEPDFCKSAFEYFANRGYKKTNVMRAFNSDYKKEQTMVNLPAGIRYLKHVAETNFKGIKREGNMIRPLILGTAFIDWCDVIYNKRHNQNIQGFGTQLRKIDIKTISYRFTKPDGKKGNPEKCYCLDYEILLEKFRKCLKDPKFKFDDAENNIEDNTKTYDCLIYDSDDELEIDTYYKKLKHIKKNNSESDSESDSENN